MILLNFSHPITPEQIAQIEALLEQSIEQIIPLPVQFDNGQPFQPQMQTLLEGLPLTPLQLQTEPILVNLPALNTIAALLLAELHGRMGYFPPVLRLRPVEGALSPRFEVAEILNLQAVREAARQRR
ncbi:MAG: CRISPR-associated protein Csx15 [Chloroflexota bacterium]